MLNESDHIDKIFDQVGQFGKYQFILLILVAFTATFTSITSYSIVFIGASPDFRCKIPTLENDTYQIQDDYHQSIVDLYIPYGKTNTSYAECDLKSYLDLNQTSNFTIKKCSEYVYSKEYYGNTIVTEWDLVCDRSKIKSGYTSTYFAGYSMVLFIGILGDKFGRKKISYICIGLCCLFNSLATIIASVKSIPVNTKTVLYTILRFFIGASSNIYAIGMVLIIELVGPKYRLSVSNSFYYLFIFGELVALLFGYFIRNQVFIHVAVVVYLSLPIFYFWFVPESPRFLLVKNRKKEATKVFEKIAKSNNKADIKLDFNDIVLTEEKKVNENKKINSSFKTKFIKAITSKKFMIRLVVTVINWFSVTFIYDGLSYNIGELGGNPYLAYLYAVIAECIGVILSHIFLEKFGRKKPYCLFLLLAGLSLLCIQFVPHNRAWIRILLGLIGKFAISFNYNAVYIVTAELYPTEIRNTIVSLCSACSEGGIIAPHVQTLSDLYWFPLPYIIYGSTALIASLSYFVFIPESSKMELMDTFDEMFD